MESLLPAKSAPQITPATANWHEGEHNAGETEDTNKESVNKQIINTTNNQLSQTVNIKQTQTQTDTNRRTHCIYTSGRLGGGAKGRSVRGRRRGRGIE